MQGAMAAVARGLCSYRSVGEGALRVLLGVSVLLHEGQLCRKPLSKFEFASGASGM